ncbi:YlbG family protein [Lentilactobacillus kisonensis]|uniref:YlbG family protein n=1 Tax=Lentilactobacillus kisonensis TaxID=481722 RepID=UPI000ADA9147|nr:YlbG family protein [Lentilactobacillus kisonensis]
MAFEIQPTIGLIVYLHSVKHSRSLKQFGRLYYVSKRMRYALLYVNQDQQEAVTKKINLRRLCEAGGAFSFK